MSLADIGAKITQDQKNAVMAETWGHLAPKKNKRYTGCIVYVIGCYDSGSLNPTTLDCNFKDLNDSPWFYNALNEFLSKLPKEFRESGYIYRWIGTFRNYEFKGEISKTKIRF